MLIVALIIPVGDDGVNPKSRFTFSFFSYATSMCNKLLLPTATIFVFVGHIISLIYFPKNVSALFNALQRAFGRV